MKEKIVFLNLSILCVGWAAPALAQVDEEPMAPNRNPPPVEDAITATAVLREAPADAAE